MSALPSFIYYIRLYTRGGKLSNDRKPSARNKQLTITVFSIRVDPVPGDTGRILYNRYSLACQRVEQGGLSHVGTPHHRNDGLYRSVCHISSHSAVSRPFPPRPSRIPSRKISALPKRPLQNHIRLILQYSPGLVKPPPGLLCADRPETRPPRCAACFQAEAVFLPAAVPQADF